MRAIFENLGATVEWIEETQTVLGYDEYYYVQMNIGSKIFISNDEVMENDIAPVIVSNRTMVPLRAIAEGFGAEVEWDGNTRTVFVTR